MSVYATIWDGSAWATSYGRIKIDYKYEPYVADFSDLSLLGCRVDPIQQVDSADRCAEAVEELMSADYAILTPMKRAAMRRFRERYMIYSFCYDQHRYGNVSFPDCDYVSSERNRFGEWGDNKIPPKEVRGSIRRSRKPSAKILDRTEKSKDEEWHPRPRNGGDRAALLDVTNDSPVVGLAAGCVLVEKTPSSSAVKSRVIAKRTPGSGEEVLRGQVRTLLQKVEEDTELVNKLPFGHPPPPPPLRFPSLLGLTRSPTHLLAPTPANTPQIPNMNCSKEGYTSTGFASPCAVPEEDYHPKVMAAVNPEEAIHPQECLINRALMFDSPEKSNMSDISTISSSLTYQFSSESSRQEGSPDDDDNSIWSVQVHASANSDRDHHELLEEEDIDCKETEAAQEEEEEDEVNEEELLGDLYQGMKKMSMLDDEPSLPEFTGKHTRFIYNSDDEMDREEEEAMGGAAVSPSVLVLKGFPAPQGKHLRFKEEDD
ncbi:hypothetical protein BHM03_00055779 [Ensete ventricosum]|nr:hypothetical protein BHM03_00055779 [Ensete ventricosum]